MADSSPGDHGSRKSSATVVGGTSSHSQPSSLLLSEDHFGSTVPSDHPSVYADIFINGLQFRARTSQEKCPSFTYASVPGVAPIPIEWKTCCDPDSDVGSKHVTYHVLTGSDKSLLEVIDRYVESNVVGLIIINSTDSVFLSNDFKGRYVPQTPPVYIISSGDGEQLIKFVRAHDEGFVQVKVLVESAVDSRSALTVGATSTLSNKGDSKMDLPVAFNFHKELEKILRVYKKEKIYACSDCPEFHFAISCFRSYEAQTKRESPDKAIKALDSFTDETFNKDFLFYLLFAYRIVTCSDVYGTGKVMNNYLIHCIKKFEALNDVQAMANVILIFVQSGDFTVQFSHGSKNDVSMFKLLYHMTTLMLRISTRLQEEKVKANKIIVNTIYRRILWISMIIYFGLKVNIEISTLASLWETHLLNQRIQRELACSDGIVKEFAKGFEVMKALQLPESVWFDYSELGTFFHPLKMQTLYISHVMKLINAGQSYLNWDFTFLIQFLPPFKHNYVIFFKTIKKGWINYSKEGTKIALYKEILRFLESILDCILKNNEDKTMADVIKTEIAKWIELLVNNINMFADDAALYLRVLRSHVKLDKKIIGASIRARGMEIVTKLTLPQFYTLFNDLQLWTFEFVEKFLNNYDVPASVDLKDSTWKYLLEEIINRFSAVGCKKCIVGLLERIGKAYKSGNKHSTFIMDLMKLDIPNLLLVWHPRKDDPNVEQLFIEMVCTFIKNYALHETILNQVPAIMKLIRADNHFQDLIIIALRKEVTPDSKMMEKLNSSNQLKLAIDAGVKAASISFTKLPLLSEVDKFCWHFIASCCAHVQPSVENLTKLGSYVFATEKLSRIYYKYWITRNVENPPVIHEVLQEICHISSSDVNSYFKWIVKMQNIMVHWHSKFIEEEFTYDDIFAYHRNLPTITAFATAVYADHLVYSDADIIKFRESYSNVYANLCLLLVKDNKEYGWCTLVEMFNFYGVNMSHILQTKLDTHLVLPGRSSGITEDDVQQRLNQSNSQIELEPEMILLLKKSMTLRMLKEIFDDLQSFLEPIASQLDFLVYFHLHNCEMFSKHLKSQMAVISSNLEQPVQESAVVLTLPTIDVQQSSTNDDEKLLQFAIALQSTEEFILSLIKGTAKHAEIFSEGSPFQSIQNLDVEREFGIMRGFPHFQGIPTANDSKEKIKLFLRIKDNPGLRKVAMKILVPTSDNAGGSAESDTHNDNKLTGLGISPV